MAETMTTEQTQTATAVAAPETATPVIQKVTRESLREMRQNRDLGALENLNPDAKKPAPLQPTTDAQPKPAEEPKTEQEKIREFNVKYKNKTILRADPDHMLGHGNLPALKRKTIMLEEDVAEASRELAEARKYGESSASEIARLKAALAEKETALQKFNTQQQQQVHRPEPTALDIPAAPVFTPISDIPDTDPVNWTVEHGMKMKKALQEQQEALAKQTEYSRKLAEEMENLRRNPPTNQDPERQKLAETVNRLSQQYEQAQQELAETARWQSYAEFQAAHPDLRTKKPLREVHINVNDWLDKLAAANGVKLPMGANQQQRAAYDDARRSIAGQWLNGDKAIKETTEGIEPPDGYEQYFAVAKTLETRDRLIKTGRLGNNATLEDAFAFDLIENGTLDNATAKMEADKLREGVNAALTAIGKTTTEYAKPLPNNAGGEQPQPGMAKTAKEQLIRLAGTPRGLKEIMADPEKRKQWETILAEYDTAAH